MRAKAVLVARVNDSEAGFPTVNVETKRNAIVFPIIRKDNKNKAIKQFSESQIIGFYARYPENGKRIVKALGQDAEAAYIRFQQIDQDFERVRAGLLPINVQQKGPKTGSETHNIVACAREFKGRIISQGLKPRSIETYNTSLDNFVASCKKLTLDEVTEDDMLDFIDWMRKNLPKRKFGQPTNTYRNRLKDMNVFFNHYGLKMPLAKKKWPKSTKKNPYKYSMDNVNAMLKIADIDEADLISFFLYTGFRDEEAAYAKYSDINFKSRSINVHDKPEYNWTVKDHEERPQDIVLPGEFMERMKARKDRYQAKNTDLIFTNNAGKPNQHLIRIAQQVGERAGIEERVTLHKFRRTFGTTVAKKYGIEKARQWLGHSDIATTQRYMAADEMTTDQSRQSVDEMWAPLIN
jgi:integrase